ncbi:MAG: tyrosine--tRNA ligase [Firmicutes bacterium]|nr:tyrosine--tRNA ligase [Bacillota bacterium]
MRNAFDVLQERGYIEQSTDMEAVRTLLGEKKIAFYIGFDPTADSLHVGHFIQIMVMNHMQRAGHTPIALVGGGTGMIGDPSGRTDMRKFMTKEQIEHNCECFKEQLSRFLSFEGENACIMVNNADWLLGLNYIEFIRDYGRHFSVNRMLTAECYKSRMESGLTFLEFNYMLMQAYDFLELYRRHGALMQLGGNDQWSNILAGADLIRRVEGAEAHALTCRLLTNSQGKKMGKTESGAVWLDANKTSPYDFYQYWRNIDDADVKNCLYLLTFLPTEEVERLAALPGEQINEAKTVLAFETTKLVHGEEAALKAKEAAAALFGGGANLENVPSKEITLGDGMDIITLLAECGLISTRSEGRRLIQDGGIYLNNERVSDFAYTVTADDIQDGAIMLRKGKKVYFRAICK